ncbi:MAG: glycosyltransferase [Methanoculleus marisnigri]|nr:glycosyltransferase [Methanoculleus marisnigri]
MDRGETVAPGDCTGSAAGLVEPVIRNNDNGERGGVLAGDPVDCRRRPLWKRGRPALAAIIPVYDEERVIGSVVLQVKEHADRVIIVDDGSADRTAAIAPLGLKMTEVPISVTYDVPHKDKTFVPIIERGKRRATGSPVGEEAGKGERRSSRWPERI